MVGRNERTRRMDLRRLSGTREAPRGSKPTYDQWPTYRVAHACFVCRRSFKLAVADDEQSERRCPGCGGLLHWMGRSFRAPKRTDLDQWKKVERLWHAGFRFQSYRSASDAEPLPDRLQDLDDFLRRNPQHPLKVRT